MKTYLIQTMRISGKSISFKETEVKAESSEQAIRKLRRRSKNINS